MHRVRIVTDSTADVPPALVAELDIAVVACEIYWGSETYEDGVDLTAEEFFDKLRRARQVPRTTQPPLRRFIETYTRLLDGDGCDDIVSIHIAGSLSGTLNGAYAAAQTLPDPARVQIIDSGQLSMGIGWAVIEAARMAQADMPADEIARAVRDMVPYLRAAAMIDNLDNLHKGGRVSRLTAFLGTALDIKPLLSIQGGELTVPARVRTRKRALDQLVALAQQWGPPHHAGVLHAGDPELGQELLARLQQAWSPDVCWLGPAGSAITTHLGLGAVGICALLAPGGSHGQDCH